MTLQLDPVEVAATAATHAAQEFVRAHDEHDDCPEWERLMDAISNYEDEVTARRLLRLEFSAIVD